MEARPGSKDRDETRAGSAWELDKQQLFPDWFQDGLPAVKKYPAKGPGRLMQGQSLPGTFPPGCSRERVQGFS